MYYDYIINPSSDLDNTTKEKFKRAEAYTTGNHSTLRGQVAGPEWYSTQRPGVYYYVPASKLRAVPWILGQVKAVARNMGGWRKIGVRAKDFESVIRQCATKIVLEDLKEASKFIFKRGKRYHNLITAIEVNAKVAGSLESIGLTEQEWNKLYGKPFEPLSANDIINLKEGHSTTMRPVAYYRVENRNYSRLSCNRYYYPSINVSL